MKDVFKRVFGLIGLAIVVFAVAVLCYFIGVAFSMLAAYNVWAALGVWLAIIVSYHLVQNWMIERNMRDFKNSAWFRANMRRAYA